MKADKIVKEKNDLGFVTQVFLYINHLFKLYHHLITVPSPLPPRSRAVLKNLTDVIHFIVFNIRKRFQFLFSFFSYLLFQLAKIFIESRRHESTPCTFWSNGLTFFARPSFREGFIGFR